MICGTLAVAAGRPAPAETGYDAWLPYEPIGDADVRQRYDDLPDVVVAGDDAGCVQSAREELTHGVRQMLGRTLRVETALVDEDAIVLGTVSSAAGLLPHIGDDPELRNLGDE